MMAKNLIMYFVWWVNFEHWFDCGWVVSFPCNYILHQLLWHWELFNSSPIASAFSVIWFSASYFDDERDLILHWLLWHWVWFDSLSVASASNVIWLSVGYFSSELDLILHWLLWHRAWLILHQLLWHHTLFDFC